MKRPLALLGASLALLAQSGVPIQYNKDGTMALPAGYREWVFLSSGLNMSYTPDGGSAANPRFDNVFVNPEAYRAFLKTGTWPDKTTLILETRDSAGKLSINKEGRVQTGVAAIEAHVKDASRGGWAFYAFHDGGSQGQPFPKTANCFTCHEQNGAVDTTFVQFYPTLIEAARKHGTYKAAE